MELWWDEDPELLATAWAAINPTAATRFWIVDDGAARVETRGPVTRVERRTPPPATWPAVPDRVHAPGTRTAVGARPELAGRDKIVMTEWGPWDHRRSTIVGPDPGPEGDVYRVLRGTTAGRGTVTFSLRAGADLVEVVPGERFEFLVRPRRAGIVAPYAIEFLGAGETDSRRVEGAVASLRWRGRVFPWTIDPREDVAGWRAEAAGGAAFETGTLTLPFAHGGPADVATLGVEDAGVLAGVRDRFGLIAETTARLPAGRWRIVVRSDAGVRVTADDAVVVENWTWHAPTVDTGVLDLPAPRDVHLRVEHFELDGFSVLEVGIERAAEEPAAR